MIFFALGRMLRIRQEQFGALLADATATFVGALVRQIHLTFADKLVMLPDSEDLVRNLPHALLETLVFHGLRKALKYGLTWESSISTFVSLMFEVAPSFDRHPTIRALLSQPDCDQRLILDGLCALDGLVWDEVESTYDRSAWV